MSENSIEQIKNSLLEQITRYQMNLEIILAVKSLIDENCPEISVLPPERKVIIDDSQYKKAPDMIIQNKVLDCIISENKTSIAPEQDNLNKICLQLSDYMKISAVLDENGNIVDINNFSVNLLVNIESYSETKDYFLKFFSSNSNFSIMTFSCMESVRREGMRYYLFELRNNITIIKEINELFALQPKKYLVDFQKDGEEIYFISDPPPQYTIVIIWMYILPFIINENGIFTINNIETNIKQYYGKWDENRTYFKKVWLREALKILCNMDWIKKIDSENFQVIKTLNLSGDVQEIVCSKIAKLTYESEKERQIKKKEDKTIQVDLFKFLDD